MRQRLKQPRVMIPLAMLVLFVAAAGLVLFQPWRLFTDVSVDEALPAAPSATSAMPVDDPAASAVSVPLATSAPVPLVLATGSFISHEHGTSGRARVLELADGSRVLRLDGLDTSNGPDLKVWLSDAPVLDGPDGWFVFDDGAYVDLGSLKGNKGNQNYPIPADVDLSALSSVTIWCDRFSVSFGAADLTPV
ncbi:MAG: DM13 domain-containing protein [Actinobacteria bacterium]|jgi:hypothetical protein|nr:DM13 domain-containing protein [Actinomycetota bacterium]